MNDKQALIWMFLVGAMFGVAIARLFSPDVDTVYIEGETVRDTVPIPKPYKVVETRWLPTKTDTIHSVDTTYVRETVDTARILSEFGQRVYYHVPLVQDSTKGYIDVYPVVQYNRLDSLGYTFTPVTKVERIVSDQNRLQPFVSIGGVAFPNNLHLTIGAGVMIRDVGIEYRYISGAPSGHMIGIIKTF